MLFVALLCSVTTAFAAWTFEVDTDPFEGTKLPLISNSSSTGTDLLVVRADAGQPFTSPKSARIMWAPGASYICATTDNQFVEWLVLDANGNQLQRTSLSSWHLSGDHQALFVNTTQPVSGYDFTDGEALFSYMFDGAEVRMQFTDDCGQRYVSRFPLDGFKDAISKLVNYQR